MNMTCQLLPLVENWLLCCRVPKGINTAFAKISNQQPSLKHSDIVKCRHLLNFAGSRDMGSLEGFILGDRNRAYRNVPGSSIQSKHIRCMISNKSKAEDLIVHSWPTPIPINEEAQSTCDCRSFLDLQNKYHIKFEVSVYVEGKHWAGHGM